MRKKNCFSVLLKFPLRGFCLTLVLLSISLASYSQFYQGMQMTFGKNRVQYKEFEWSFFRFPNFDTYFYVGGQELALYTAQNAEKELEKMERRLEYKLEGKIQFIIFNRLSDLRQSNIGVGAEEAIGNIGGYTRIIGNKVFLYFDGTHEDFLKQIRAGIAQILINQILYGGDIKDRLQNAAMLTLPDWYLQGLVSYLAESWNVELDNKMRDGVLTGRYRKFNHLEGQDAIIAGHSIWFYISQQYGEGSLPNVLFMTKSGRNIENGFLFVYGLSFKNLMKDWYAFYTGKYKDAEYAKTVQSFPPILKKPKKNTVYKQLKASPDGKYLCWFANEKGRYKVYLYNTSTNKKKVILKAGYKSNIHRNDESFPLVAWHPQGKVLSIIREHKGKILLDIYTIDNKSLEESELFNFDKILDFSYSDDGNYMVMSAVQKGQSDIFVFNLRARTAEQITKDFYDDLHPRFINNSRAIIFSSNRPGDTLFVDQKNVFPEPGSFDIYIYDYRQKSYVLRRLTNTPKANEFQPMPYDRENLTYLSDENGIVNRYIAHIDSVISAIDTTIQYRYIINTYPQTDNARNILSHDINQKKKKLTEILYQKGRYYMYNMDVPKATRSSREKLDPTEYRSYLNKLSGKAKADSIKKAREVPVITDSLNTDTNKIDINHYLFQSDFQSRKKKKKAEAARPAMDTLAPLIEKANKFVLPTQQVYEPAFYADHFVTQLDNSLIAPTYQTFGGQGYTNPGLGALIKVGASDVMEDYKIVGGFRVPFDLTNTEYFVSVENLKKRMDKQLILHRQSNLFSIGNIALGKIHTHEIRYIAKWPFSEVSALKGTFGYRNDRFVVLSTDSATLQFPNFYNNWANTKFEFIYDNTISTGLNLFNGTRLKIWGETFKQVDRKKSTMVVIGTDIRHYERIHRDIIWANRLAGSSSFGDEKLIYYLGGVDNPLIVKSPSGNEFDNSTPIDYTQNYAFQAVATNMRGFIQNARNGNNFVVYNSELRIPLFKYLLNRPIKSEFTKNFQVVGFFDAGTAWVGSSPFKNNLLNTETIERYPFTITLTRSRDPFVYGYGFGLRSKVLGYFVRADWAWGIEDKEVQPRVFYLTFNLDF